MRWYKKLGVTMLAAAMVLSSAACSTADTSWILKSGETVLPAGVYLYNMVQAYTLATYQAADYEKDILEQQIEEKDATEWIKEKALDNTEYNMAVIEKFNEKGLALTEEEKSYAKVTADNSWSQLGDIYEKNGIAKTSMILLNENYLMQDSLFQALYGEGGEQEVPEEELKKAYEDSYIKVGMITVSLPTKTEPAEDATDEEKKQAEDSYNTTLEQSKKEADDWYVKAQAAQDAGKDFNEIINLRNKEKSSDPDAYDMETNNFNLLSVDSTRYSEDVMDALKNAEIGKVTKIEGENQIIIAVRKDVNEDPADFEGVKETVLHNLKDSEFTTMLTDHQKDAKYTVNEDSVNRYTPKKLKFE